MKGCDLDLDTVQTNIVIFHLEPGAPDAAMVVARARERGVLVIAFGPRTVVYVSCDPATQMRDLRYFLAAGYALAAAQPFDLFPQTRHIECVLTLVRGAATVGARSRD